MTLFIDDTLMTGMIAVPLREGWVETDIAFEVVPHLTADKVGRGDVALISLPEASMLVDTHYIDPSIAVVSGLSPDVPLSAIALRTPVRPDEIEQSPIRMVDTGPTAEVLIRALLRSYFGITADGFIYDAAAPEAAETRCVVIDGLLGLIEPELGFQEDLVKSWYVLTGTSVPYAVAVVGVDADGGEHELALLREALAVGIERRRDVRGILASEEESIGRDKLAAITNGLKYRLDPADTNAASNLLARGTWGTNWRRHLPAVK